jgi:HTH-type transcriptional regulator, cell division transcriptional repressor
MAKKRPLTEADQLASRNLRKLWDMRKSLLQLTQEKAAEDLGYSTQSAVSQYLCGDIALNTDAVLRFAKLLRVRPGLIDPRVSGLLEGLLETPADWDSLLSPPRDSTDGEVVTPRLPAPEAEQVSAPAPPTLVGLLDALASQLARADPLVREAVSQLVVTYLDNPEAGTKIPRMIERLLEEDPRDDPGGR